MGLSRNPFHQQPCCERHWLPRKRIAFEICIAALKLDAYLDEMPLWLWQQARVPSAVMSYILKQSDHPIPTGACGAVVDDLIKI